MKSFDMIQILKLIKEVYSNQQSQYKIKDIEKLFSDWHKKYQNIKNPDWSFLELENVIKKEEDKINLKSVTTFKEKRKLVVYKKLSEYIEKFKKYN